MCLLRWMLRLHVQACGCVVVQLTPKKLWQLEKCLLSEQPDLCVRTQKAAGRKGTVSDGNDGMLPDYVIFGMSQEHVQDDTPQ